MATIEQMIERYMHDEALKQEVDEICADKKITPKEFITFVKKYDLDLSLKDLPGIIKKAKELGFL